GRHPWALLDDGTVPGRFGLELDDLPIGQLRPALALSPGKPIHVDTDTHVEVLGDQQLAVAVDPPVAHGDTVAGACERQAERQIGATGADNPTARPDLCEISNSVPGVIAKSQTVDGITISRHHYVTGDATTRFDMPRVQDVALDLGRRRRTAG